MSEGIAAVVAKLASTGRLEIEPTWIPERAIGAFTALFGFPPPTELHSLYDQRVSSISGHGAFYPGSYSADGFFETWGEDLKTVGLVPIFYDGFGNDYCARVTLGTDVCEVYFIDDNNNYARPAAAASSIARFLRIMALATEEGNSFFDRELVRQIDPDIERCALGPPLYADG